MHSILRLPAVIEARGRKRSTHYLDIKNGVMTAPIALGARSVGWPAHEVAAINAARISGKTDEEIRELVKRLEAERKTALEKLEAQT